MVSLLSPLQSPSRLLFMDLKQQQRPQLRRPHLKSEVALLQTLSRLFHVVHFVKCWHFFLHLISKRLSKFRKRKESRCLVFTSSTKREIRQFHPVVVHWQQRNIQKSVMHVRSCCFANLNVLLFFCSRWCRRLRFISSLRNMTQLRSIISRFNRLSIEMLREHNHLLY